MEEEKAPINVNISSTTIIKVMIIVALLWFIYLVKDVILILIVALILASAFNPWVTWLKARRVPRIVGVLVIYLLVFGIFALSVGMLIPPIVEQLSQIGNHFPEYYDRITNDFENFKDFSISSGILGNVEEAISSLQVNIAQTTRGIFSSLISIFGGFFAFIGVVVITFYMLIEENAVKRFLGAVAPEKVQPYLNHIANRIQEKISQWLRGQIILSVIIGAMSYVGLLLLGVDYALVLALWAGLTEFIPYLGPFIGAVPAVFIAFTVSPFTAVLVIALYALIQQLENNFIVPRVMSKAVGLNPLIVIIVMLVGAKLAGLIGIVLAVPITLIIEIFFRDFMQKKGQSERRLGV